jgi:hypothetical protein
MKQDGLGDRAGTQKVKYTSSNQSNDVDEHVIGIDIEESWRAERVAYTA